MKVLGFLIILAYVNSIQYEFSFTALVWLLFGIALCLGAEGIQYLERTVRYIHRDKR